MSIVVLGAYSDFLVYALARVQEELGENVVFWTAHPKDLQKIQGAFPLAKVQSAFDLTRGDVAAFCRVCEITRPSYEHLSKEFIEGHGYEREYVLNNLLHRADPGGAFTHEEIRDTLNNYFFIANNILNKFRPRLIYFDVMPHTMYDLAVYLLAKRRGIKVMMITTCHIGGVGYITHTIGESLGDSGFYMDAQAAYEEKVSVIDNALSANHLPFYMSSASYSRTPRKMFGAIVNATYAYMLAKLGDYRYGQTTGYEKARGYLQSERVGRFGIVKYAIVSCYHELLYRRWSRSDKRRLQAAHGYAYVPLSMQHEATTMPAAGAMYDQKSYITLLLSILPPEIKVVIKENPKQFRNNTGILNRSKRFYEDLRRIGVVFAAIDESSDELISGAAFTVITTGTAGFESIHKHKTPVLSFSKNWYIDMPGVTYAHTEADVREFVDRVLNNSINIGQNEVDEFVLEMKRKLIYIYHDWDTAKKNGWNLAAMGENLYGVLKQELSNSNCA